MTDEYQNDDYEAEEVTVPAESFHGTSSRNRASNSLARRKLDDYLHEKNLRMQLEDVFQDLE